MSVVVINGIGITDDSSLFLLYHWKHFKHIFYFNGLDILAPVRYTSF